MSGSQKAITILWNSPHSRMLYSTMQSAGAVGLNACICFNNIHSCVYLKFATYEKDYVLRSINELV